MEKTSVSLEFAGKEVTFETGHLAPQATTSILARTGDTMVLVTIVQGNDREDLGYFPLSIDYVERLYAGGRIKGSRWVKREGKPTDESILTGRLIDRSIRPLFPKEYKREVQVIVTVLAVDGENAPDILALNAVSAALAVSPIPWNGPVAAIRMGYVKNPENGKGEYIANPTATEGSNSELDIVVSQLEDLTLMIEAGANQMPEDVVAESIKQAHIETRKMLKLINDLTKKIGQKKIEVAPNSAMLDMAKKVEKAYAPEIAELAKSLANKESGGGVTAALIEKIYEMEKSGENTEVDKKVIAKAVEYVLYKHIRHSAVAKKERQDGRKVDELRQLGAMVGVVPRVHGSAIFERGITQSLTLATLGSPRMEQLIESAEGEESKRYIHHYNFPPYSVGEAGRFGFTSRREVGHGALAERALEPVIPTQDKFPYTIRMVSEILSSNGSTSMAATCASTLALMDAGVPITKPVAGISIGRMSEGDDSVLLTDIIGLEDFSGDMDFKVAGTDDGITAIQLDVKIPGLNDEEIVEILSRAQVARIKILEVMLKAIPESRTQVSLYAPKIEQVTIPVEKIGEIIGPGGRVIKNIIATTGATVDVEDDGIVTISGTDEESVQKAVDWVKGLTREVLAGEIFDGPVKRILPFGAFVEILPGKEGMVHVSKMGQGFVKSPEDVVKIGQVVKVKVSEIDDQGRLNLTMKIDENGNDIVGGGDTGPAPSREGSSGGGYRNDSRPGGGDKRSFRPAPRQQVDRPEPGNERLPVADAAAPRSEHPLSRQFQRERRTSDRANPRKRTHY
jgi:polyribonucleotide nucleotidyltransferase